MGGIRSSTGAQVVSELAIWHVDSAATQAPGIIFGRATNVSASPPQPGTSRRQAADISCFDEFRVGWDMANHSSNRRFI
ncbi:predicted protein [Histoplasma capsulatum G186AR]|uniref:Uncharacterized protein n=1 Tax=Ajellomyces capsulatus (strain G186AR / H82 / ATCC MYA-2454 / RMSCC 2432) TaxID=447093 RepID=C0NJT0_AJECG|nr:uncharacterized protein HCBG_03410 [Histoplasma capsulatum G186AR]EEH08121.1 predicted protein [Histoplasma capsulatum G186AR]